MITSFQEKRVRQTINRKCDKIFLDRFKAQVVQFPYRHFTSLRAQFQNACQLPALLSLKPLTNANSLLPVLNAPNPTVAGSFAPKNERTPCTKTNGRSSFKLSTVSLSSPSQQRSRFISRISVGVLITEQYKEGGRSVG